MDQQAEICETYQLRWSSYNSYIHSCIATSFHNDTFTDVALVTTDGHQIMAHRFVLSYSSLFLAQIIKLQKKVTTTLPLMIILPPEIDHKSLKVLIRYMYSGEAKVSKDILKNVLRGGDILQIKGLYREKEDADKNVKITQQNSQKLPLISPVVTATPPIVTPPVAATKPMANSTKIMPKLVQHSKPATTAPQEKPREKQNPPTPNKPSPSNKYFIVQKPKEQKTYGNPKVLNFTIMQNPIATEVSPTSKKIANNEAKENEEEKIIKVEPKETTNNLQYLMIKDEPIEWSEAEMEILDSKEVFDEMLVKSENTEENESNASNASEMFSPLTCELCTETFTLPGEWVRHVQTHTDMLPAKRRRRDSTGDSYENDTFPELMCDLCQKAFPTPSEWVKHIQSTHTEFELHMSNRNTPDGKNKIALPVVAQQQSEDVYNKHCTDCKKIFSSHASMLIHKRRHTGEKPYVCEYCQKTFNVKSNLLRHLRTLHNKIINSTDIDNKDASDISN